MIQGMLGARVELARFEACLKASLVIQSLHNPAAKSADIRVLNVALGDFTAQLTTPAAVSEAVLSVQVRPASTPLSPWLRTPRYR